VTLDLAVYHPWTYLRGGAERVLAELVTRSHHRWTLYTHHFAPETTYPVLAEARVVELAPRVDVRRSLGPLASAAVAMARTRLPDHHQGLLVSSEGLGDLVVLRAPMPAACFCHTPLKIRHDPVTRAALAERHPRQARALAALGPVFDVVDRMAWTRYRHVLANSAETVGRIARAGLRAEDRVEVLHPGVDLHRFAGGQLRRDRRFVAAGRIMWQKRLELAIDAFVLACRQGLDAELVVAGAVDDKSRPYLADLRRRAAGWPVVFEPDVSDERMAELLTSALACVCSAPNEDFGIVPLEAMAAGTPVIAVDGGGARETVVHGSTGWLVDPCPEAFAACMLAAARDEGGRIAAVRRAARARATLFGWDAFVDRVDEVMAAVAAGRPVPPARPALTAVG
jgi:glycosyltransferase involved in cell wall biosynthesis